MKKHRKVILVPTCVTTTDDALQTVRQAIRWFERQTMYLKAYHRKTWTFITMPVVAMLLILYLWLPFSLFAGRFSVEAFLTKGGAGPLIFTACFFVIGLFFPLLGSNPRFGGFYILQPFSVFSILLGAIKTLFTNTVTWGNVKYKLTMRGTVASIERPVQ